MSGERRRGFTPRGWLLLVVGVAAVLAAFAARERELLMVAGLGLGAPLLCSLWVSARRNRVTGDLAARPHAVDAGESGELLLTLRSSGALPTPVARILPPAVPESSPVELTGAAPVEPPLRRGAPHLVELPFRGRRRGRMLVPSPVVRFADPFGLWREDHTPAPPAPVLVLPPVVALDGLPPGLDRGRAGRDTDRGGEPDVVVRPYVPGDDIRTIHWRASARLEDDLVVRVREAGAARSVAIVLDDRPRAHTGDGLEVAIALAASIGMRIRRAGLPLSVSDAAGHVLLDGEEDPERLLVALALVGDSGDHGEPGDHGDHGDHGEPGGQGGLRDRGGPGSRGGPAGRATLRAQEFAPEVPGRPELVVGVLGHRMRGGEAAWLQRLAPGAPGLVFSVGGAARGLPAGWQSVVVAGSDSDDDASRPAPIRPPEELRRAVTEAWRAATGVREGVR